MTDAPTPRKPKLYAGCVEVELQVAPMDAEDELLWREATTTPRGAQIVLTDEGPWLRLESFATWPVLVQVPTAAGDVVELRLGGTPQLAPPPRVQVAPTIERPQRPSAVDPEVARLALTKLKHYLRSFAGARSAPEDTREKIVRRAGEEMTRVWELVRHVPEPEGDELRAHFDEITAAMPAARQLALEQA